MGQIIDTLLIHPILNILVAIYQVLAALHIPSTLGFAIILLTIVIRVILYPVISAQLKTSKKMQKIAPHLSKVREKHKGDAQKIQQETMRLYQEHGVNPAAGCIPLLIQLPIIWALYGVLQNITKYTSASQINDQLYFSFLKLQTLWQTDFFGVPLFKSPGDLLSAFGVLVFLVPVITGILQYFQSKMLIPPKDPLAKKDKPKGTAEDFAAAFQTQSHYLFPIMIGFFSYSLPVGLSLYWNTFSVFGIIQQQILERAHKKESAKK